MRNECDARAPPGRSTPDQLEPQRPLDRTRMTTPLLRQPQDILQALEALPGRVAVGGHVPGLAGDWPGQGAAALGRSVLPRPPIPMPAIDACNGLCSSDTPP